MEALAQRLRVTIENHCRRIPWRTGSHSGCANRNPLSEKGNVKQHLVTNIVHIFRIDGGKMENMPSSIALVCEHAVRYWFWKRWCK